MEHPGARMALFWQFVRENAVGAAVVAVEAVLIALVLWGVFAYRQEIHARTETRETVGAVDQAVIAILDVETAAREFVAAGEGPSRTQYGAAVEQLDADLVALDRRLNRGSPAWETYERLAPRVAAALGHFDAAIAARQAGNGPAAEAAVSEGRSVMGGIRADLATIRAAHAELLERHVDRSETLGTFIGLTAIALAFMSLVTSAAFFVVFRRRHEAEALRAVSQAKDEFVGFVSHELRNPIAIISGNLRLLEDGHDGAASSRAEAIAELRRAADRLEGILETLLSLAKAESGQALEVEPILLQRVVEAARRHHRSLFPGRQVNVTVPAGLVPALGDRVAVEQVLINLLSNAEKYGDADLPIEVAIVAGDSEVTVSVLNHGSRLSPHEMEHLFEPFFRSPGSSVAPGVGLGLTVCHRLIAAQGGRMRAEALAGGGARFSFVLPLAPLDETELGETEEGGGRHVSSSV